MTRPGPREDGADDFQPPHEWIVAAEPDLLD